MKIINEESSMDLGTLLGKIQLLAPDIYMSRDLRWILPQRMGDLEKPEFLNGLREKIEKMNSLQEMLEKEFINQEDYDSMKNEILFGI